MKNINLDFLAKELLYEEEGFKLAGRSKQGATTKNYKIAKTFLKDKISAKSIADKIKNKEAEQINPRDLERHLLSFHIAKKVAGNKRLKQETRDEALKLLKKVGIDITSMSSEDEKVMKIAKDKFEEKYKSENPSGEAPTEEPVATKEPTEEPTTAPTKPEIEEPETEEPEEKVEPKPAEGRTKYEEPEVEAKKIPSVIRKLKNDTLQKLRQRIEQSTRIPIPPKIWDDLISAAEFGIGEAEEEPTKHQIGILKRAIIKLSSRLDKYAKRAKEMPSTASDQLSKARTEALRAQLKIVKLASPGMIEILTKRAKETAIGAKEKVKETISRASETIGKTQAGEAIKAGYGKAKEFAQAKAEQATEKLATKIKSSEEARKAGVPSMKEKLSGALSGIKSKIGAVRTKLATQKTKEKIKETPSKEEIERKRKEEEERKKKELQKRFIKSKKEPPKIRKVSF